RDLHEPYRRQRQMCIRDRRLPVPIVKASEGWRFDMAAGEEEVLTRAIGRNELSAIAAMHAYVCLLYTSDAADDKAR
ncbi:DUF2950 family protein, partial [Klebsiella pneumoniae]|nr:DUF2950 family protein [Klebsiella pneumoniae]